MHLIIKACGLARKRWRSVRRLDVSNEDAQRQLRLLAIHNRHRHFQEAAKHLIGSQGDQHIHDARDGFDQ